MSATDLDPRDRIILEHAPLVAMPRFGNFPPITYNNPPYHRFIAAEDGLWLELGTAWLYLIWPVAPSAMPLPYGEVLGDEIEFAWQDGDLDDLVARFIVDARKALPDECAAWGVWNTKESRLEYRPLVAIDAGPGGVTFHRPQLAEHEQLAVDIHSHGAGAAFFSATDDADDEGSTKLAIVVGNLDTDEPTRAQRLCALGLTIDYAEDGERACRVCGCTQHDPCEGGCSWVEDDLCSRCA